jgi:hypothetical protein
MSGYESRSKRKDRPSFILPIVLIAVGVVFLLSNLGFVKDNFWNTMWRIWPLIFIIIGLDSLFRRNEIAGPVFMIGLGTIILLSSVGLVGWRVWDILWRLWPILLVAIGLEIIAGRRYLWVSILIVGLMVTALVGVLWVFGRSQFRAESLKISTISHPLGEIDDANISISPVVGDLTIDVLNGTNGLITGRLGGEGGQGVYTDYYVTDNAGVFSIGSQSFMNFPGTQFWDWDFYLTNQIPLELNLSMGVGNMNADLSNLILQSVVINQAIGEVNLTLTDRDDYRAELSQAIGSIIVELPEDSGVRIKINRAISALRLPSNVEQKGDHYYSQNYETSEFKIDLEVNQAIGSIEIR